MSISINDWNSRVNKSLLNTSIHTASSFEELVTTSFHGDINAICWKRELKGNFSELVDKLKGKEYLEDINEDKLNKLKLSEEGELARDIVLTDFKTLRNFGSVPTLNIVETYKKDDTLGPIPTDVYSFHVDRSPVPTDTFLCTYFGMPSEILPNQHALQKILIPEIRNELIELYGKEDDGFETFLKENFYDIHYQAKSAASPIGLGVGLLWRLAVDHPESQVAACIHRAPKQEKGNSRLLMIS